jgi:hypothetical protein
VILVSGPGWGLDLRIVHGHFEGVGGPEHRLVPERGADTIDYGCWAHGHGDRIDAKGCARACRGRSEIEEDHTQEHTQAASEH